MSDYKVGYGKPPKTTQFKPGRSGNPAGRPKGSQSIAADLAAELRDRITIREQGRPQRVSKQRALLKSLMAKALQGDVRATAAVLGLYARVIGLAVEEPVEEFHADEIQIIQRFAPRLLKSLANKKEASK
jgi:hypothetical protein